MWCNFICFAEYERPRHESLSCMRRIVVGVSEVGAIRVSNRPIVARGVRVVDRFLRVNLKRLSLSNLGEPGRELGQRNRELPINSRTVGTHPAV